MEEKSPSLEYFDAFDFRELPIGVYMTSLDGQFIVANKIVRQMLELPLNGKVNVNIKNYYFDPSDRDRAIEEVKKKAAQGKNVERGILHLKVGGRELQVEDYCKTIQDEAGEVIGFVGCMVDVTSDVEARRREKELQQRVEELSFDIGRILHANNTTLVMVIQALQNAAQALGPNPFPDLAVPSADEISAVLSEAANSLASVLEGFLTIADDERRLKALPAFQWKKLSDQVTKLRTFKERVNVVESYPSILRTSASQVMDVLKEIAPKSLPREPVRDLNHAASQLLRVTTLVDLFKTRSAVLQMDYTLQSLREYITADIRETPELQKQSVQSLIEESVSRLTGFAQSAKVEIKVFEIPNLSVTVNVREIVRALSNLLHNAIKYTWRRDFKARSWVSIRCYLQEGKVNIEFENWGVPIAKEEIEKGLIFNLGYRGRLSKDRGRLGTGIGLTDARRIAETHGGDLIIHSRPAHPSQEGDVHYYDQPFITTAILSLPVA